MPLTSTDDKADARGDFMSPQPEEPEFQWLEDALVQLAQAGFAMGSAIATIFADLIFAVWSLLTGEADGTDE